MMTGVGVGVFKDIASAAQFIEIKETFNPRKEALERYYELYPIYRDLYKRLNGSFDNLVTTSAAR